MQQAAPAILMVRPAQFGANPETAASNIFQKQLEDAPEVVAAKALEEFDAVLTQLKTHGIEVIVVDDTAEPKKTDAIFPNNWISSHADGTVVLYPMLAASRRFERRPEILATLSSQGHLHQSLLDFSPSEQEGRFLEGTGSMVFDYTHKKAYACASSRTDKNLALQLCDALGMELVWFDASAPGGGEIYHTNVILSVSDSFVIVAMDLVAEKDRPKLKAYFEKTGKQILSISFEAVCGFLGNSFLVQNKKGEQYFILSEASRVHLTDEMLAIIARDAKPLFFSIPIIEKYGGGSIRCMLCAIYH